MEEEKRSYKGLNLHWSHTARPVHGSLLPYFPAESDRSDSPESVHEVPIPQCIIWDFPVPVGIRFHGHQ